MATPLLPARALALIASKHLGGRVGAGMINAQLATAHTLTRKHATSSYNADQAPPARVAESWPPPKEYAEWIRELHFFHAEARLPPLTELLSRDGRRSATTTTNAGETQPVVGGENTTDAINPNDLLANRTKTPKWLGQTGYVRAAGARKAARAMVDVALKPPPLSGGASPPHLVSADGVGASVTVNGIPFDDYFLELEARYHIMLPLRAVGLLSQLDETSGGNAFPFHVRAEVHGGGRMGQAQAMRLGMARALSELLPDTRRTLKKAELLTRDPRVVESKVAGRRKARKKEQWSKR